ncbi:MAG: hypothetical protein AAGH88_07045 [Planctomycetota bacterium]
MNNPTNQRADDMEITRYIPGLLYLLFTVMGVGAGIAALFGIGRYGKKRILIPAIVGIVLHIGMLALLLNALQAARRAAERMQQQQQQIDPAVPGSDQDSSSP